MPLTVNNEVVYIYENHIARFFERFSLKTILTTMTEIYSIHQKKSLPISGGFQIDLHLTYQTM